MKKRHLIELIIGYWHETVNARPDTVLIIDNGHRSHRTLGALAPLSACSTSDVLVTAPLNRKLALLLAIAASAAPTLYLFSNIHNEAIFCLMKRFCKTIKYI